MIKDFLTVRDKEKILDACEELASSEEIVAACFYGSKAYGYVDEGSRANVLLVARSHRTFLKSHKRQVNDTEVSFLIVDQRTFEKDVESGWLGELMVESLSTPYVALVNEEYLWDQEVKAKKRIASELISNLVLEFPELSYDIQIKPEYFIFETMARRASLFPPLVYSFMDMLGKDLKEKNMESMMKGFKVALDELAEEREIGFCNGYVKIQKDYIDAIKKKRPHLKDLFKTIRKEALRQILRVFPKVMPPLQRSQRTYSKFPISLKRIIEDPLLKFEDSKKYLYVPTPFGLVTLSDKTTIEDFVKRTVSKGAAVEIDAKKIGGVLNSVYLLRYQGENQKHRVVVKLFKDWYGLKWFPLALWALGTQDFSVLGKSRLEKEYAINRLLSSQGIRVPGILYVSPKERLIFEEFVEGWILADILRRFASQEIGSDEVRKIIRDTGRTIARIHNIGVALGDCKPENMVVSPQGDIYLLDLEQASRGGDQAWDIAEFLFYAGHYFPLFSPLEAPVTISNEFVEGYLETRGNPENVRKAGSARYVKVFSIFTPPHVLIAILNASRKILKGRTGQLSPSDQVNEGSE